MSIEQKLLIPRYKNSIVRDPIDMSPLPEKGTYKPWTGPSGRFWRRRVKDGSVYIGNSNQIIDKKKK